MCNLDKGTFFSEIILMLPTPGRSRVLKNQHLIDGFRLQVIDTICFGIDKRAFYLLGICLLKTVNY